MKIGIREKIVLLAAAMVVVSGSVALSVVFSELDAQLVKYKQQELIHEVSLQGVEFRAQMAELTRDVQFLNGMPAVQGIVRAMENGGIDPEGGTSTQLWLKRLGEIFAEMSRHKPQYVQIRYIGVADGGREILRIDRGGKNGSVQIVPAGKLAQKGRRGYFQKAIALNKGEVYLSPIELNREQDKIAIPHEPVIRAATPVYGTSGTPFGIIIINENMDSVFDGMAEVANPHHSYLITNGSGDYLRHPEAGKAFAFEFGRRANAVDDFPVLGQAFASLGDTSHSFTESHGDIGAMAVTITGYNPAEPSQKLGIIVTGSRADISRISSDVLGQALSLILLLLLIAILAGTWFARRLSAPFLAMSAAVRRQSIDDILPLLPVSAAAEAGVLARSLRDSLAEIKAKTDELKAEVRERKLAEESLREVNLELSRANAALEQFTYIASHDLQEPLRTMGSFVQLLEEKCEQSADEEASQYLQHIANASGRMRGLIKGLLEHSRIGQRAEMEEIDCRQLVGEIIQDMGSAIADAQARIHVGELPVIKAYRLELRLLLQNLIGNAVKFRDRHRAPEISISCEPVDGRHHFSVADNGIGIPESHLKSIFNIFERLHADEEYAGSGIGLAHCKKIVELHRGRLWAESVEGKGSTFHFII